MELRVLRNYVEIVRTGSITRAAKKLFNAVCTYNLAYNAAVMVAAGLGSAVCIDGLVPSAYADSVVFRPFSPAISSDAYLAWRKGVPLSPAAAALVERVRGQVHSA
jgi:DNA-binding transcriptional LysR family regulator